VLAPSYTNRFGKDLALAKKRGKDTDKLKKVIALIVAEQPLPPRLRDHVLVGKYTGRRECHIEPDWLLVYKLESGAVIFERTGTHADLF
jgi:mRNA interferase YafQ